MVPESPDIYVYTIYMSELSGTKVDSAHSAHAAGQNGKNQLWYPKAQTYIYIYILYICLSSRVPKLILPGSMGRMNFGTLKLRHIYIYIYILYICLGFGVPKFILPMLPGSMSRMGRMNFGTPKAVTSPPGP